MHFSNTLIAVVLMLFISSAHAEKRLALVIGNANYQISPLKNPVNDAKQIAQTLRHLNFKVIEKYNLSQQKMTQAIREFGEQLSKSNVGLFYFSGHGMQVKGKNYLIPIGGNIKHEDEIPFEAVDVQRVLAKMESARNGLNILLLDACRNNPYQRSFRSSTRGLARMDAPVGTIIAYATAPGKVASDGQGSNGLFTRFLLKHMKTKGIDISEVLRLTRRDVLETSKRQDNSQVPWDSSSLVSKFCFSGCGGNISKSDVENLSVASSVRPVQKHSQQWYIDRWKKQQSNPDARKPPSSAGIKKKRYDNFIDNGNLTITDTKTGLMWKKCSEGQENFDQCYGSAKEYNWTEAQQKYKRTSFAGFNDWRLPTINELRTLVYCGNEIPQAEAWYNYCSGRNNRAKKRNVRPTLMQKAFPNSGLNHAVWSSTSSSKNTAYYVFFGTGKIDTFNKKFGQNIRLVRRIK